MLEEGEENPNDDDDAEDAEDEFEDVLDDAETGICCVGEGGGGVMSGFWNKAPCNDATFHSLANNRAAASSCRNLSKPLGRARGDTVMVLVEEEVDASWPRIVTVSRTGTGVVAALGSLISREASTSPSAPLWADDELGSSLISFSLPLPEFSSFALGISFSFTVGFLFIASFAAVACDSRKARSRAA